MYINYHRLFNLHYSHDYYVNGKPSGMSLQPTSETSRLLKGGKMLFKTTPGGVTVLYRALQDEITPMVNLPYLRLRFVLKVSNPAKFLTVTNLDSASSKKYKSPSLLYFKNDPASASVNPNQPEAIEHELIDAVRPSLFTFSFTMSDPPEEILLRITDETDSLVIIGKDESGDPIPAEWILIKNEDDIYRNQVDLRGKQTGKYVITIRNAADTETLKEETIYVDDELWGQNIMGIVDLIYQQDDGQLYGETEEYELRFNRKQTRWKYFIVLKNRSIDFTEDDLFIEDTQPEDADFYAAADFSREGDAPHESIRIQGNDTVIFKSNAPVPFFELPKTDLRLKKIDTSETTVLIKNLPNPSPQGVVKKNGDELVSEIYVMI